MRVYYTFSQDSVFQPFKDGWVEVVADSMEQAGEIFRRHYPDRNPGILNCAGIYTEDEFRRTEMYYEGNFGAFCHRRLNENTEIGGREAMEKTVKITMDLTCEEYKSLAEMLNHASTLFRSEAVNCEIYSNNAYLAEIAKECRKHEKLCWDLIEQMIRERK